MRPPNIAAINTVLNSVRDKKGKAPSVVVPVDAPKSARNNYGSAGRTMRTSSGSAERLERVPEDDATEALVPGTFRSRGDDINEIDEESASVEIDEVLPGAYARAVRLYSIVPLNSLLLLVLFAAIPSLIWPMPQADALSPGRSILAIILTASLWTLSHALRIPTFKLVSAILILPNDYAADLIPFLHSIVFVTVQELLRLSCFAIFSTRWKTLYPPPGEGRVYVYDPAFREVWFLALGWALAEMCAGILQGYEQLSLYDEEFMIAEATGRYTSVFDAIRRDGDNIHTIQESFEGTDTGLGLRTSPSVTNDSFRLSMPYSAMENEDLNKLSSGSGSSKQNQDLEASITHLTNVKARDELEEVYGMAFIDIPIFVSVLQRLDSILLSLGLTLVIGFAYLSPPPWNSKHDINLFPTFVLITSIHAFLGILHTPPLLGKIGIHAAAYIACLVGLGVLFAGIGIWVGLW